MIHAKMNKANESKIYLQQLSLGWNYQLFIGNNILVTLTTKLKMQGSLMIY